MRKQEKRRRKEIKDYRKRKTKERSHHHHPLRHHHYLHRTQIWNLVTMTKNVSDFEARKKLNLTYCLTTKRKKRVKAMTKALMRPLFVPPVESKLQVTKVVKQELNGQIVVNVKLFSMFCVLLRPR